MWVAWRGAQGVGCGCSPISDRNSRCAMVVLKQARERSLALKTTHIFTCAGVIFGGVLALARFQEFQAGLLDPLRRDRVHRRGGVCGLVHGAFLYGLEIFYFLKAWQLCGSCARVGAAKLQSTFFDHPRCRRKLGAVKFPTSSNDSLHN